MNPRDFLEVAAEWSIGSREAEWRSTVSRGYYAAFHVARTLLVRTGFAVPAGPQAHGYLNLRLQNSGHAEVNQVGASLAALRSLRNQADYDLDHPFEQEWAFIRVQNVVDVVRFLDDLARVPDVLARVVQAIRDYERDVLQDVTYRSS